MSKFLIHRRIHVFIFAFLLVSFNSIAQQKFDAKLQEQLVGYQNASFKKDIEVNVLLQLNNPKEIGQLNTDWCQINSHLGNVATARVKLSHMHKLAPLATVTRVNMGALEAPEMDSVKVKTNAWAVQKDWGPIDRAYTGKGTIIGIVDTGIDYYHPEFRDRTKEDETRILYLWNQWDDSGTNPDSFSYGSEYNKTQ
ncbi:MAG: hypothetical protein KDC92_04265, partial [Bacteroidetes bacterium]|nr:hypothetical protein [Bacteroidota bacterium]